MRFIILAIFSLGLTASLAQQTNEEKLIVTVKEFHRALVNKNTGSLNQHTDKALSYGHSNGWVETKKDLVKDWKQGL